jgi:surface protein
MIQLNRTTKTIKVYMEKNITLKLQRRDYPLNLSIIGEGSVEERLVNIPSVSQYPIQDLVELIPIPKDGWVFEGWEGDLNGSETSEIIILDSEKTITFRFKEIPKFYLHENDVTCMCPYTQPGEKGFINGVEYESVDNYLLRKRRDEGVDMTKLCTSLVTDMSELFQGTFENRNTFNRPIDHWDVSKVTDTRFMFRYSQFNQPLGNWDVSQVTDMSLMFNNSPFNQPIGNWDVSKVTDMWSMFCGTPFNQAIGNWDVSKVTDMRSMFSDSPFNQPIGDWDVSKVTDMGFMFFKSKFNQPIGDWDVGNVCKMWSMFSDSPFNQPIGNWDVSKVTDMGFMFFKSKFNQAIDNWDVSKVTTMRFMFTGSTFNQNISKWCVKRIPSEPQWFSINSPLTSKNKPKWGG